MKLGEIYVALGIKPDRTWKRLPGEVDKLAKHTESRFAKAGREAGAKFAAFLAKGVAGGALVVAGAAIAQFKSELNFDRELTRLGIASDHAMGSLDDVRKKVMDVSKSTGVAREEVLRSAAAFTEITGDGEAAAASMELFARVNKATGASMEDIAGAAAAMHKQLKVTPEEMEQAFSIMIAGGKAGSVELRNMASEVTSLAAAGKKFKGAAGLDWAATLSAALQLTTDDFGSVSEAATGMEGLFAELIKNAKELKKAGVDVFATDSKGNKAPREFKRIIEDIGNSKLARDPEIMASVFGRGEARKALEALITYGRKWDDLIDTTRRATDVSKDYAEYQGSNAAKVEKAWNGAKIALAEAFTPERIQAVTSALVAVIDQIGEALGKIQSYVNWVKAQAKGSGGTKKGKTGRAAFRSEFDDEFSWYELHGPALGWAASALGLVESESPAARNNKWNGGKYANAPTKKGFDAARASIPGFLQKTGLVNVPTNSWTGATSTVSVDVGGINVSVTKANASAKDIADEVQASIDSMWRNMKASMGGVI